MFEGKPVFYVSEARSTDMSNSSLLKSPKIINVCHVHLEIMGPLLPADGYRFRRTLLIVSPNGHRSFPLLARPVKQFPKLFYITGFLGLVFPLRSLPTEVHNSILNCSLNFTLCLHLNVHTTAYQPSSK